MADGMGMDHPLSPSLAAARGQAELPDLRLDDSPPTQLFAMEVGSAFADASSAVGEQADMMRWTALRIGDHLAERGQAGNWHAIDGLSLAVELMSARARDRQEFTAILGPMLVWLVQVGAAERAPIRRTLLDLRRGVRSCRETRGLLERALVVLDYGAI